MRTHVIDLTNHKNGTNEMFYQGKSLGHSDQPLYDAARILLNNGLARREDIIATRRGTTLCLRTGISWAAGMKVAENKKHGPRLQRYAEYEGPDRRAEMRRKLAA